MEYQKIRFGHDSRSHINKLLVQREFYPNQRPYTKAIHSDPYVVKRFNKPESFVGHDGCVNTVEWNETGNDCNLNIWSPFDKPEKPLLHSVPSGHTANIFSAKFMPKTNDRHIVSCSADGIVRFTDLNDFIAYSPSNSWNPSPAFQCHTNMTFEVLPDPNNPYVFFSCADDGRIKRYDLRISKSCDKNCRRHTFLDMNPTRKPKKRDLQNRDKPNDKSDDARSQSESESEQQSERSRINFFPFRHRDVGITAMSIRPDNPIYLAAACGDDTVRIYDRRFIKVPSSGSNIPYHQDSQVYRFLPNAMRQNPDKESSNHHRMTSLKYDPNGGGDLCVSYSSDKVYLIRPGAGLIDKPRKTRKGAVRISRKKERDESEPENKPSDDNVEGESPIKNIVGKGKAKEENSCEERDTIPTSYLFESTIKNKEVDNYDEEVLSDQDNRQPVTQKMNDIKDEDDDYDDYMYSSDEDDEEDIDEVHDEDIAMSYTGHLNSRTMIKKAYFFGAKSEYIMSGSDDGRVFIWDKLTGKVINLLKDGDTKVVNCVQPHPYYPILCTSGIDYDVKLWYPKGEENDLSDLEMILRYNEEEARQESAIGRWGGTENQFSLLFALLSELGANVSNIFEE
ncbi:15071_t:CDS:2 [Funneliformis caledonium]|uniref:15071_t:CDS:1 n=1 Tax=Funneliformis caledonium TaxID=1117310 RepID=A0A9N9AEU2_9GLOM|nr:15071_t:CDS:2 [Funneliformis caledonium]